jgi:hypothetical protein
MSGQLLVLQRKQPPVLSGPQSRSGRCGEETNRTPAVQPVARHYIDRAIPALLISKGDLHNTAALHQGRHSGGPASISLYWEQTPEMGLGWSEQ